MESKVGKPLNAAWEPFLMSSFKRPLSFLAIVLSVPCLLHSQAWLSPGGQGTVSTLYQYGFDRYHVFSQGEALDRGHTTLQSMMLDVDYSLTDRLAIRLGVPFIEGRYDGDAPHLLVRGQPNTIVALDNRSE